MLPGIVLLCGAGIAMSISSFDRWLHQADVPSDLVFAAPVARALRTHSVQIERVYRATHYEIHGIVAAGFKTKRGIAIALRVPATPAAQDIAEEIRRSFGADARALTLDGVVLLGERDVLAAIRN